MHSFGTIALLILFINGCICYSPIERENEVAALVSSKLYFYGGWGNSSSLGDLFYIDLNQQFNASDPTFQLLAMLEHKVVSSAVAYKEEIIIFGRDESPGRSSNSLIIINETSNYSLNIVGNTENSTWPSLRDYHTAVIDTIKAKMYIWGGTKGISNGSASNSTLNDGAMYKFDILSYSWEVYNASSQPICRVQHTATMTPDGNIIMIGGLFNPDIAQKTNIIGRVYARWGHTATLTTNNQSIIIFGGQSNSTFPIADIAVLNLSTYIWTSITPFGEKPRIFPFRHTATLYNYYIIFAFGSGIIGGKYNSTNIVSILDISNDHYEWVTSYYPRVPNSNAQNSYQSSNSINIGIVVGSIFGSIISVGLLIIISYLIYSNNKLKKEIKYSGTQPYNDETNEVVDNK
ncbi:38178_t:CDS:2 [Gigaspora margarita]|uniref:38178_t:CDS:1 n=1 Tax=Gigaspora margarita TaxID=4874 RepID=A0ABM8W0U7_GIGMA|nr:38178_t:CDS:2 [Gigaspora margarita]